MKDKAFGIFIYDLCVLGRDDLIINETFLGLLHGFILSDLDNRFEISSLMFDVTEESDHLVFQLPMERIVKACETVHKVSTHKCGYAELFDGIDFKDSQNIGQLAVSFSNYLDILEEEMYKEENGSYKLLKN